MDRTITGIWRERNHRKINIRKAPETNGSLFVWSYLTVEYADNWIKHPFREQSNIMGERFSSVTRTIHYMVSN